MNVLEGISVSQFNVWMIFLGLIVIDGERVETSKLLG